MIILKDDQERMSADSLGSDRIEWKDLAPDEDVEWEFDGDD